MPGAEIAALGLVVWLIYTVDRLLDGRTRAMQGDAGAFGSPLRQRHVFHRIHARRIAWVAAGVAAFTAILVLTQIGGQVLKLAVPVGVRSRFVYGVGASRARADSGAIAEGSRGGRSFCGGSGVAGVVADRRAEMGIFVLAALFAAVCTLNCVAIEEWERGRERNLALRARQSAAARIGFGSGKFAAALAVCATLLAPVVRLRGEFSAIGAAIAVSALLILFLDLMRERISADALRVLVDVALLAPALVVLVIR